MTKLNILKLNEHKLCWYIPRLDILRVSGSHYYTPSWTEGVMPANRDLLPSVPHVDLNPIHSSRGFLPLK